MDTNEKWAVIAGQRRVLAILLAELSPAQWEHPSLCAQWRVQDVAAHLALTPQSPGIVRIVGMGIRARGDFDGVNRDLGRRHAARGPEALVRELRDLADNRSKPAITTLDNLLFDTMVHIQDAALPLGIKVDMPLEAARLGVDRVWRMGWPFWAKRRLKGLHLRATDTDWTAGEGAGVQGTAQALLLLLTGRTDAARPMLDGPGVAQLI